MKNKKIKAKEKELIELVSEFCDEVLDDEYKQLSIKLVRKMGRKHNVPFKRGKPEIWASAVIYALGQINLLFDKSSKPYSSADEICDFFNTKKSTVSNKARSIRETFNLNYFDDEFSITQMQKNRRASLIDKSTGFFLPDNTDSMDKFFNHVYELSDEGNIDEAISLLDTIPEDSPEYSRALFYKSMILGGDGDEDSALDLLKQSLILEMKKEGSADDFDESELEDTLRNALSDIDKENHVEFSDLDASDFEDESPEYVFNLGFDEFKKEEYEDALMFFNISLEKDPNQSEALYYKALSLGNLGEFEKAIGEVEKAIEIDSTEDRYWCDKGNFLARTENYDEAIECFDEAIRLNPADPVIWCNKGFTYLEEDKFEESLESYTKALELNPKYIHALMGLAHVYIELDNFKKAEECFDKAEKIDDCDFEFLSEKGKYLLFKEDVSEALRYFDKCLSINENSLEIWMFRALAYSFLNNEDEANYCVDRAMDIDPLITMAFIELLDV